MEPFEGITPSHENTQPSSHRPHWQSVAADLHAAPTMYEVHLINDGGSDVMVNDLLAKFFNYNDRLRQRLFDQVTLQSKALCEVYTRETAETKVAEVNDYTFEHHYPLKCVMQKSEAHVIKKS